MSQCHVQVGQLLDAIETAGKRDDTLVMMSSDHGGFQYGHGRKADSDLLIPMFIKGEQNCFQHMVVQHFIGSCCCRLKEKKPFFVDANNVFITGPGVKVNHQLRFAVGNIDIAPTAARALGLKPSPWWRGSIMSEAFQDGVLYENSES